MPGSIPVTPEVIRTRLILIGDAGSPDTGEPVLQTLEKWAAKAPEKTHVVFLGDNLYPDGMALPDDPWRPEAERLMDRQINAVLNAGANGIFIPGNHDWATYGPEGLPALLEQEKYIEEKMGGDNFLPSNGHVGPVKLDLDGVRIIILDTHRWIYAAQHTDKNVTAYRDSVMIQLANLLTSAGNRQVVVLGHHPLATHGPHGGFFSWEDHLFPLRRLKSWLWAPLPIVGSLYPFTRWNLVKNDQDINGPNYSQLVKRMKQIFVKNPPLIYAAGHEHTLQVIDGKKNAGLILVTGAGSQDKKTAVGHGKNTLFSHLHTGFMVVDFTKDGKVYLRVVEPAEPEVPFRYQVSPR